MAAPLLAPLTSPLTSPLLTPLLLPVLLLWGLGGARAQTQGTCGPPDRKSYAELEEKFRGIQSFPIGSQVSFICRPGYMRSPGKPLTLTCGPDLQWSPREQFCTERKCKHPGEFAHGLVHVTDLTFGSMANFSCQEGYRLLGNNISCVIKDGGVDWDGPLPFCELIPCAPPPAIANGRYREEANYVYQTAVTYECDEAPQGTHPFSLIGSDTIYCMSDEHSNGVWSGEPPQCKVVICENPKVKNGKKISGFGPSYSYKNSIHFQCDPGYFMVGSEIITCEENNTWSPPEPTCKEITAGVCDTPKVTNGVVIPMKSAYEEGESVQIKCNAHCSFPDGTEEVTVGCQGQKTWTYFPDCGPESPGSTPGISSGSTPGISSGSTPGISSGSTPVISYGRVVEGQKPSYFVGDRITIECYAGYTLHGVAEIQYIGGNQWSPGVPTCQLSGYVIACICVLVVVVVLLAGFWAYKKFFSQNGKRDSTPCTAEYKICKA